MLLKAAMPFNFSSPEYLSHHRTRKNRVSPVSRASPAHMNSPLVALGSLITSLYSPRLRLSDYRLVITLPSWRLSVKYTGLASWKYAWPRWKLNLRLLEHQSSECTLRVTPQTLFTWVHIHQDMLSQLLCTIVDSDYQRLTFLFSEEEKSYHQENPLFTDKAFTIYVDRWTIWRKKKPT